MGKLTDQIRSFRNHVDFYLRDKLRWSREIESAKDLPTVDARLQEGLFNFLNQFEWHPSFSKWALLNRPVKALDVGCRNFNFAPSLDQFFKENQLNLELHGIEVDAYRRMRDFHSRADYGNYYASQIRNGHFHAMDFLDWGDCCDVIFLLNPFVSSNPLLAWGLPLRYLQPERLFAHARQLLHPDGLLVVSSPSLDESKIAMDLAHSHKFSLLEKKHWTPASEVLSEQPRFGSIFRLTHQQRRGKDAV